MPRIMVTTWFLEMHSPAELHPATRPAADLRVERAAVACPELNRFLYCAVGGDWYWLARLSWSYERWMDYLTQPGLETWIGLRGANPVGYYELAQRPDGAGQLAYFGLLPQFLGQGYGGVLLTAAVRRGWERGATSLYVNTCSLDGPTALANYQARGFRVVAEKAEEQEVPDQPPGPWPGAR